MNLYDIRRNLHKELQKEVDRFENAMDEYTRTVTLENMEYLNKELKEVMRNISRMEEMEIEEMEY